jgi:uncharacterized membrane protein YtjA (UPF0391 family)
MMCRRRIRALWHFAKQAQVSQEDFTMLGVALVCFGVALVAAFLGFAGIAGESTWVAKVIFFIFLALAVLSCGVYRFRRRNRLRLSARRG